MINKHDFYKNVSHDICFQSLCGKTGAIGRPIAPDMMVTNVLDI